MREGRRDVGSQSGELHHVDALSYVPTSFSPVQFTNSQSSGYHLANKNTRFIPNREGQDLQASFSLLHDEASPATPSKQKRRPPHGELHYQKSKF